MTDQTTPSTPQNDATLTRRDFIRTSAAVSAAAFVGGCATTPKGAGGPGILHAENRYERIRIGLIGCGGRGTGAAMDCVRSSPNIEIVALGDVFEDRVNSAYEKLQELGSALAVERDRRYSGFDAYQRVLACDLDLVVLAAPPGFRPLHYAAAIEAGKHVFMEKPVAVDPVGVRKVIAASALATEKGLAVVTGTQRRHEPRYLATMKRILDGAIGDLVGGQCYWNQGDLWVKDREPGWTDMEWQCRNWLYFCWLSGDHIVEQHVHNLDVMNWAMKSPPNKAMGLGGRQVRTGSQFGDIYDHFAVEYEYPNGARILSTCRQTKGASERVSERLVGTKGVADPGGTIEPRGWKKWTYEAPKGAEENPYVLEHKDLIASIRKGKPLNEGRRVAESTLTAIMGRMSAYTGREVSWDWVLNASKLDLTPPKYEFGDLPVGPIPMPGLTELV